MKKIISLKTVLINISLMLLIFMNKNVNAQNPSYSGTVWTFNNTNGAAGTLINETTPRTFTGFPTPTQIIISAGVELVLTSTWNVPPDCRITVNNQAFLNVIGGTIQSTYANPSNFSGDYWRGIEVLSDVQITGGHTSGIDEFYLNQANYFRNHWQSLTHGSLIVQNNGGTRSIIRYSQAGCVSGTINISRIDGIKQVVANQNISGGYIFANNSDFINNVLNSIGAGTQTFMPGYGPFHVQNCSLRWTITLPSNTPGGIHSFINIHNVSYNAPSYAYTHPALKSYNNFFEQNNKPYYMISSIDLVSFLMTRQTRIMVFRFKCPITLPIG